MNITLYVSQGVDDAIYVNSKDDGKYLQFQRDHKFNLYYIDISKANVDEYCYPNTVKRGKSLFSILNQKRAEAIRILQERCVYPSDKDFTNALEYNSIVGVDFGRREVNIVNDIYDYSKGACPLFLTSFVLLCCSLFHLLCYYLYALVSVVVSISILLMLFSLVRRVVR